MKQGFKLLLLFTFCLAMFQVSAQIETPAASPWSKVEQKVGLTTVTVEYSRPGMKGRKIFGSGDVLVGYGSLWRTGANGATKVTFSEDVKINDSELAKGTYAILSEPGASSWKVHFYPYESRSWSSYREKTPALSVMASPKTLNDAVESFTIDFQNLKDDAAEIVVKWENTAVPMTVKVETDEVVMASIEKVMAGPSNNDYYNAANYYYNSGKDMEKALEWIQKATQVDSPRFWHVRREALILHKLGRTKDAIAAATLSRDLAQKAGNMDYVKMNEKSIAEWK